MLRMARQIDNRSSISAQSRSEYIARINKALQYIERHLAEELKLQTVADVACFSQFHFHRIFSGLVGETPSDFIKRIRLERAANMLYQMPESPITEIALTCGFSSSSTFSRAFAERFQTSPSRWRELKLAEPPKTADSRKRLSTRKKSNKGSKKSKAIPSEKFYVENVPDIRLNINRKDLSMHVEIQQLPQYHVAYVANLEGYNETKIGAAWAKLCRWAGPRDLLNKDTLFIGVSFDNPDITPENKCRYYACITVPAGTEAGKEIGLMDIPGGKHAVLHFKGTTDDIRDTYRQFYGHWLPSSGFQPAEYPCYEIYRNDPKNDPDKHHITDICMPVKPL